jgi:hypothetical protein
MDNVTITVNEVQRSVLVSVREGPLQIQELSDANISSPADGQALLYNATSGKWENDTVSGSGDMLASVYDPLINANTAKVTDARYTFTQAVPSASWSVTHGLDKFPSVDVVDTSGNVVEGDIQYIDSNNVTITFSASFAGKAYFN